MGKDQPHDHPKPYDTTGARVRPAEVELPEPRIADIRTIFFYDSSNWENVGRLKGIFQELGRAIRDYPEARYKVSIDITGFTPPAHEAD